MQRGWEGKKEREGEQGRGEKGRRREVRNEVYRMIRKRKTGESKERVNEMVYLVHDQLSPGGRLTGSCKRGGESRRGIEE